MAHPVDRLVHRAFLLDIRVRPGDIGFGLVIIVIRDEIFDRIVGKKAREFAIKLRGENLVGRKDQRGPLQFLDHLRHRKCLARAGYAQQHLSAIAFQRAGHQIGDGGRLIARRLIFRDNAKRPPGFDLVGPRGLVRHKIARGIGLFQPSANYEFSHPGNMENKARPCNVNRAVGIGPVKC